MTSWSEREATSVVTEGEIGVEGNGDAGKGVAMKLIDGRIRVYLRRGMEDKLRITYCRFVLPMHL